MNNLLLTLALVVFFAHAGSASATTYYIAASGSDSNNGTSKTTPWLHAPGMPNCTATCATVTPQPGDSFIFRGGDTWHAANSSASPYVGTATQAAKGCGWNTTVCGWYWHFGWNGTATNCTWPTVTSSCIYIGVDKTWFTGTSWTRPAIDMDNPTSKSLVSSCAFDQGGGGLPAAFAIGTSSSSQKANYVIFDNFEIYGGCGSSSGPNYLDYNGVSETFENLYIHGWTEVSLDFGYLINQASETFPDHNVWAYNVADGSDSYCTGFDACSAYLGLDPYDFEHNICRWMGGCISAGSADLFTIHDNLFEHVYQSYTIGVHGNVVGSFGNHNPTGTPLYFYNNLIRNVDDGRAIVLGVANGGTLFFFNNVMYGIGNAGNCVGPQIMNNGDTINTDFSNNTIDAPCSITASASTGKSTSGTVNWSTQNNHFIGFSGSTVSSVITNPGYALTLVLTDNGNEIFQSEAVARKQGYTAANNYRPTSASGATYHAGRDLSLGCSTYSPDSALCSGSTGGVRRAGGVGLEPILRVASPPLRGTAWDAGAYQFSGQPVIQPKVPKRVVADVH